MKRNSTRHHRTTRQNVLHLRVVSPRIVWFGFLRYTGGLFKFAAILTALAGLGWGAWRGVQHVFYQNPDFQLKVIDLNPNPVVDELGVAELAGIDLTKSPSLFEIDVARTLQRINALPAITEAKVERHLPDTLVVRVTPRTPRAWLTTSDSTHETRRTGALLVDTLGIAYPCPANQLESLTSLPVIHLAADPGHELLPGKPVTHPSFRHCLSLLESARDVDAQSSQWIDSIRQANNWSLVLTTRNETKATFSLGDHASQLDRLRAALDHAAEKGLTIGSINLIPKYNVPVTLGREAPAPRAIPVVVEEPEPTTDRRRNRDLNTILNRP
jgi:POTRA domain, FtsQ-type